MADFSMRLKEQMRISGLKGVDLAVKFGVTKQAVSSWTRGVSTPDAITLARIASLFGVSAEYLLGMTNKRTETVEDHLLDQEINSAIYKLAVVTSSNPATYKKEFPPQTAELLRQELDNLLTSEEIDLEMTPDDFDRLVHEIDDPDFKQDFLDALNRVIALQAMAALKSNQLQITVSADSIFHGKPEKLQGHVDNLDTMEPALAEKLLQKIASSAELFPRSTKKPLSEKIKFVNESGEELSFHDTGETRASRRARLKAAISALVNPKQAETILQQTGRLHRAETDELLGLGTLSPDDFAFLGEIMREILAEKSKSQ